MEPNIFNKQLFLYHNNVYNCLIFDEKELALAVNTLLPRSHQQNMFS